jgi:hypothetical protein
LLLIRELLVDALLTELMPVVAVQSPLDSGAEIRVEIVQWEYEN